MKLTSDNQNNQCSICPRTNWTRTVLCPALQVLPVVFQSPDVTQCGSKFDILTIWGRASNISRVILLPVISYLKYGRIYLCGWWVWVVVIKEPSPIPIISTVLRLWSRIIRFAGYFYNSALLDVQPWFAINYACNRSISELHFNEIEWALAKCISYTCYEREKNKTKGCYNNNNNNNNNNIIIIMTIIIIIIIIIIIVLKLVT